MREMQKRKKVEFEVVVDVCALSEHVTEVVPQPSILQYMRVWRREGEREREKEREREREKRRQAFLKL